MPEVLRLPVADAVHTLAAPSAVLDAATAAVVEAAVADARREAYARGEAAGRAAAEAAASEVAAALATALDEVRAQLRADRQAATAATIEVAERLAAAVLDAAPADEATVVLARLRAAIELLDDVPLEVHLAPATQALLADHLTGRLGDRRVTVVADPTLAPAEARIVGADGGAELTRRAMLAAAVELLDAGADPDHAGGGR